MSAATKERKVARRRAGAHHNAVALLLALIAALTLALGGMILLFGVNTWKMNVELVGEPEVVLEYGTKYEEAGASARLTGTRVLEKGFSVKPLRIGTVNESKLGTYKLTYWAQVLGWGGTVHRTVTIQDTTAPVITLKEDPTHYTIAGQPYQEEGYRAEDNYDGDLTDQVTITEKDGVRTYTVTDSSGNQASVQRVLVYKDPLAPELKLKGEESLTMLAGDAYEEPGWTATDNADGDLSDQVKVKGAVNTYRAGTYTLTYSVKDSNGNKASAKRTVTVEPKPQPEVVEPEGKVIYLTFDDGPGPYTEQLLDVLARYGAKATFFTCNTPYADLMVREVEEGHTVAIHSATHDYSEIYSGVDNYFKDLYKQQNVIYEKTGVRTTILRFPGGSSNESSMMYKTGIMTELTQAVTEQGLQYFDWNVLSGDAGETKDTDKIVENVIKGVQRHDVSVVLQHDIHKFSVDAVERIIVWGLDHGYKFLALQSNSPICHQDVLN